MVLLYQLTIKVIPADMPRGQSLLGNFFTVGFPLWLHYALLSDNDNPGRAIGSFYTVGNSCRNSTTFTKVYLLYLHIHLARNKAQWDKFRFISFKM